MRQGVLDPPKKVVLLHPVRQPMGDARRRAEAMAAALDAKLVIVKLTLPGHGRSSLLFSQSHPAEGALQQALREVKILERWQALRERHGAKRLEVTCCAPSVEDLLVVCAQPGVAMVVMPASSGWFASRVTNLAARAGVPVLLAQRAHEPERVLAATAFDDSEIPVLEQAAGFAQRLHAPLTLVHNVTEELSAPPAEVERELEREALMLGRPAQVHVTHEDDPADAILHAADGDDTDLIVLGVRPAGHDVRSRVPERVCAGADCSVLLVPVAPERRWEAPN
jgi:nucleotide-binding universal stress UspA family protein